MFIKLINLCHYLKHSQFIFISMLMPKKNRVAIYEHLFKEGVMVAKKDFTGVKHPEIDVPNLHVIKALQVSNNLKYFSCNKLCKNLKHFFTFKLIKINEK